MASGKGIKFEVVWLEIHCSAPAIKRNNMSKNIKAAYDEFKQLRKAEENVNVSAIARKHGVSRSTLQGIIQNGGQNKVGRPAKVPSFVVLFLKAYCVFWDEVGTPLSPGEVKELGEVLSSYELETKVRLSKTWVNRFRRDNGLTSKKSRPLDYRRRIAESIENAEALADAFVECLRVVGISVEDITANWRLWCMDESGMSYRFDKDSGTWVVVLEKTESGQAYKHEVVEATHRSLSIVAAACAAGAYMPPFYVVSGNVPEGFNEKHCKRSGRSGAYAMRTRSGSVTTEAMYRYVQHFDQNLPEGIQRPVILMLDGHIMILMS